MFCMDPGTDQFLLLIDPTAHRSGTSTYGSLVLPVGKNVCVLCVSEFHFLVL